MKKKSVKKLVLTKETVRRLGALALNQVAAGDTGGVSTGCGTATFYNSFCRYCLNEPL